MKLRTKHCSECTAMYTIAQQLVNREKKVQKSVYTAVLGRNDERFRRNNVPITWLFGVQTISVRIIIVRVIAIAQFTRIYYQCYYVSFGSTVLNRPQSAPPRSRLMNNKLGTYIIMTLVVTTLQTVQIAEHTNEKLYKTCNYFIFQLLEILILGWRTIIISPIMCVRISATSAHPIRNYSITIN